MLYTETVAPSTLELLVRLMGDTALKDFILVGGTSLSLQIGHRISIDLFSENSFDEEELSSYLISHYNLELDFISHRYPLVKTWELEGEIRLASLWDIAAMKLNAISGNGTRIKDFIDIAYLSNKLSFAEMLKAYELKYKANAIIPLKSIVFFDDINLNEPIKMLRVPKFSWKKITTRLYDMQKYPE